MENKAGKMLIDTFENTKSIKSKLDNISDKLDRLDNSNGNRQNNSNNNGALNYMKSHPVPDITGKQVFKMLNAGYDQNYIRVISGLPDEKLDKMIKSHVDRNF